MLDFLIVIQTQITTMKAVREVGTSDCIAFINVAPPAILADLKTLIDKRLAAIVESNERQDKMRKSMQDGSGGEAYEPAIIPDLSDSSDARAQLAMFASGAVQVEADLRSQLAAQQKVEGMTLEELVNVKLVYKSTDQYGDGIAQVVDLDVRKKLEVQLAKCKLENLSFPYGYGPTKDCVKLKKFSRAEPGQALNVGLRFSRWNYNGKSGFSCYVK